MKASKDALLHRTIQSSILKVVQHPDFEAALPPLSDETWLRLLSTSQSAKLENERLEFLGDALMYATIGRQLYAQIPNGTPHLYTVSRRFFMQMKPIAKEVTPIVFKSCSPFERNVLAYRGEIQHTRGQQLRPESLDQEDLWRRICDVLEIQERRQGHGRFVRDCDWCILPR